jgi:hypothetical protein
MSEEKKEPEFLTRMKAEVHELQNKCIKLNTFINTNPAYKTLGDTDAMLLQAQYNAMCTYHDVLACRINRLND